MTVCVLAAVLISILPHLIWWPQVGAPFWIADHDDLLYLSICGQAYFEHPTYVADPTQTSYSPTFFPGSQLVPAIVIARLLDLGPLGITLLWRLWAGVSVGITLYLVLRQHTRLPITAVALGMIFVADHGTIHGVPLFGQIECLVRVSDGPSSYWLQGRPQLFSQWRIITPGLSLAFLFLHVWLVGRARARGTWGRVVMSGLGFGLLIHVYFYYWTTAALALLLAFLVDAKHRSMYFHTGWIGGLIGLPGVIAGYRLKQATNGDWLPRSDKFLPIGRFSELLIHKRIITLMTLAMIWIWPRCRELLYLVLLVVAAMMLMNHQVVTGLQIENFHWIYVAGPCMTVLFLLLVLGQPLERFGRVRWLVAIAIVEYGLGLGLRTVEVTQSRRNLEVMEIYAKYEKQNRQPDAVRLVPNQVIAGEAGFLEMASVLNDQRPFSNYPAIMSPAITNLEWDDRIAVNQFLLGEDLETFKASQREHLETRPWGPWGKGRDADQRAERLASREASYEAVARDPDAALDRYTIRYLALPAGKPLAPGRGEGWSRLQQGPHWDVWERRVSANHRGHENPA